MLVPTILLMPRGTWAVLPYLPGVVNAAPVTLFDAHRHVGGALPYLSGMGVDGAHNTIGENVGVYNTVWALLCQGGCRVWSPVLLFDLCALP